MNESKPAVHTATPWRVENGTHILSRFHLLIADTGDTSLSSAEQVANARLIVRAVNSHAALVEALRGYVAVSRCENPIRVPLPNPEGYAEKVRCEPCGKCRWCAAERALALAEEQA